MTEEVLELENPKHHLIRLQSDYADRRKRQHHLVVFDLPEGYGIQPSSIRSKLPFARLNRWGHPRNWRWVKDEELAKEIRGFLKGRRWGVLVPATFFWIWSILTLAYKNDDWVASSFRVKIRKIHGSIAEDMLG